MNKQKTISINGTHYDAHTGLRVATTPVSQSPHEKAVSADARSLHKTHARTHTLNRAHVKAPHKTSLSHRATNHVRSPMIRKFSHPTTAPAASPHRNVISDMSAIKHPVQKQVEQRHRSVQQVQPKHPVTPAATKAVHAQPKPAAELKHHAITKALHNAKAPKQEKQSFAKRHPRLVSAGSASLAIVLLAGYLTYINLPDLSVRVAAVQAGVDANYPSYQPSGYSLNGPVAYSSGEVSMKFAANVGPQNFTVKQTKSSWDSSALLDNYVQPQSNTDYVTFSDSGLTIYVYGTNAAWVNGGVLHTIEGNAPLTTDQIRRIATSM